MFHDEDGGVFIVGEERAAYVQYARGKMDPNEEVAGWRTVNVGSPSSGHVGSWSIHHVIGTGTSTYKSQVAPTTGRTPKPGRQMATRLTSNGIVRTKDMYSTGQDSTGNVR
jgi:hypothetical protein